MITKFNIYINESIRDKMVSKEISPEIKQNLLKTLNDISFLPVSNLKTTDTFKRIESLEPISNILESVISDLYYVCVPLKNYYVFKDIFGNFATGDYKFHNDGEYDYFIYKDFKIVWCEHDRYYDQTIDMYIIDLPYFKKSIQKL